MDYEYYFSMCDKVAEKSKCFSRKIGVLVMTPDLSIINTAYNGPARKVSHCDSQERLQWLEKQLKDTHVGAVDLYLLDNGYGTKCPRQILKFKSGEGLHLCQAAHAERNAIANCAREGIKTKNNWMLMNCSLPCQECSKGIIGAGFSKIICVEGDDYDKGSRWILDQAGIEIVQIKRQKI
jgi:deoxycytidylate deaminase